MQNNLPVIKYQDDKVFDILNCFSEIKKNDEISLMFDNLDKKILFLCYFAFYVEYNLNEFNAAVIFNDYCKFIDFLIDKLSININNEGGVIAMIKILLNFLSNNVKIYPKKRKLNQKII